MNRSGSSLAISKERYREFLGLSLELSKSRFVDELKEFRRVLVEVREDAEQLDHIIPEIGEAAHETPGNWDKTLGSR